MKTRRTILATLGIIAVLVPAAIWAAGPDGHGGMGFGMGVGQFAMGAANVLRFAKKLDLSADQVTPSSPEMRRALAASAEGWIRA